MPRHFDDQAREKIATKLQEVGLHHFVRSGIRSARVADICTQVGIAKGSFYRFYKSKESLFMSIANGRDEMHKREILTQLTHQTGDAKTVLIMFFTSIQHRTENDPILKILRDMGDLQHLIRTVPPELLAENNTRDRKFMQDVAAIFTNTFSVQHATSANLEQILSIMLSLTLQRDALMSAQIYDSAMLQVQDLFVARLLKGNLYD